MTYCDRPYGALEQADALAIVTEWNEFRNPDFEVMRRLMRQPVIFDGRNLYDPPRMAATGLHVLQHRPRRRRRLAVLERLAVGLRTQRRPAGRPGPATAIRPPVAAFWTIFGRADSSDPIAEEPLRTPRGGTAPRRRGHPDADPTRATRGGLGPSPARRVGMVRAPGKSSALDSASRSCCVRGGDRPGAPGRSGDGPPGRMRCTRSAVRVGRPDRIWQELALHCSFLGPAPARAPRVPAQAARAHPLDTLSLTTIPGQSRGRHPQGSLAKSFDSITLRRRNARAAPARWQPNREALRKSFTRSDAEPRRATQRRQRGIEADSETDPRTRSRGEGDKSTGQLRAASLPRRCVRLSIQVSFGRSHRGAQCRWLWPG